MNYHKLTGWADTLGGHVNSVVFDEIQELRHSNSLKFSAARHIAEKASFRVGLSATPIFNYGGEIYNVLSVLAPTEIGTHAEFMREWCIASMSENKVIIKDPKAFGDWMRDEGLMIRRTREDVKRELPACTTIPHFIEADLEEIDKVAGSAVELAKVILSAGGRGFDKMKAAEELDWRLRQATGIAKAPYVAEFVRILVESGERVLLYTWHHAVNAILVERLKEFEPVLYTGEESQTQKDAHAQAFKEGKSRVLIMSNRAGAGLDGLQHCCRTVVVAELDWSPAVMIQGIGRVHRDGQPDPVMAYVLIAECGSDPVISDALGIKKRQSDGLLDVKADPLAVKIDPEKIKSLAASFLASRKIDLPPPPQREPAEVAAAVEYTAAHPEQLGLALQDASLVPSPAS